ncbi:MAG TPA: cytochrome c oxidase subunit II [Gemmatimonadales bacterium]|nr:cytochrome c oxidase subunit II [Gemmatimonadales bacterium]
MPRSAESSSRSGRWSRWLAPLLLLAAAGCAEHYPQTTLLPKGDFARMVDHLMRTTVWWAIGVFVLVEGALVVAMIRFREKPGAPEPPQTHGNTVLEIVWTIIPAAILAFIAVPTVRTIFRTSELPGGNSVQVDAIGHQWWFEFRYPMGKDTVVTADEMHVPLGRTVDLRLTTVDVIHSFWVPQFAGKRDMIPGHINHFWFKADTVGVYPSQCAEFCGEEHGRMGFRIVVDDSATFAKWEAAQLAPFAGDTTDSLFKVGKGLFITAGCIGCHAMAGQPTEHMMTMMGPNLSHVGSRGTIVAGRFVNSDSTMSLWLRNPQAQKPGALMKLPRALTEPEIAALVHYVRAHR